jgi:hypothetical protein
MCDFKNVALDIKRQFRYYSPMTRRFLTAALLVLAAFFVTAGAAHSQVLIYKLEFKQVDTLNLEFFQEGYFITEALGGTASFVLGGRENGRRVLTEGSGGTFTVGEDNRRKRHAVLSAGGGSSESSSTSSFVAFGPVNSTIHLQTPTASIRLTVASKLEGAAVAAGSEAATDTRNAPEVFANISAMKAELDDKQTRLANRRGQDTAAATAAMKILLQQKGYTAAATTDPETPVTPVTTTP